jgi:lipopolysaccharide transport system permease protein
MLEPNLTVYSPIPSSFNLSKLVKSMWNDLRLSWDLAYILAKRDIKSQYRQSLLGYFWAFFTPIFNASLWLFLQSSGIVKMDDTGMPYAAYVLSGTILWQIFTDSVTTPLNQMVQFRDMLAKLNFPREAVLLNGLFKVGFNSIIKLLVLIPAMLVLGVFPDWHAILFPLSIISLIITGLAIGLILAPIGSLYTDVSRFISPVLQLAMYISPVLFAIPPDGLISELFQFNFVTPLIATSRAWLSGQASDWIIYFIIVNCAALLLLFIGWVIFRLTMPILVERMSS